MGRPGIRHAGRLGWLSPLPVLAYRNVRCAPVLESHSMRHGLPNSWTAHAWQESR